MPISIPIVACLLCFFLCQHGHGQQHAPIQFEDVSSETHITFTHSDGSSGRRFVVEPFTAGLAVFDFDNDGWLDIFFLNGAALPGTDVDKPLRCALYRNNGDWTFTDVTEASGALVTNYALGVVAGDYDCDGDCDLWVANYGPINFLQNNGDGTFSDLTNSLHMGDETTFGAGLALLDVEGDGDLDLYAARYQVFAMAQHKIRMIGNHQFHPGPLDYPPAHHALYRNEGDGTFSDISQSSGIGLPSAPGMGVIAGDFDEDGDADIWVANDNYPNFYFDNDGTGVFTEQAALRGLAVDRTGRSNGNMGVECADFDGDGLLDFLTTTYQDEMPVLYRNAGDGLFEDYTNVAKIDHALLPHVKWGVGTVDFDNDRDVDIFIATGHFMDNIRFITDRTTMKVTNFLLENNGKGRFKNVTRTGGSGLQIVDSSRGSAHDDLDNDGRSDIVVLNFNARPNILKNTTSNNHHWIDLQLIGRTINRDAVGAKVIVHTGNHQSSIVHAGRGYQSHYGTRLHFGLGDHSGPVTVEVIWRKAKNKPLKSTVTIE